ncbi:MAG: hypothetical protein ACFFB5_24460 [Promethearchaeota archaeon]
MIEIKSQYKIIGLLIVASFIFSSLLANLEVSTSNSETDSLISKNNDISNEVCQAAPSDPLIKMNVENSEPTDSEPTNIASETTGSDYWLIIENETKSSDTRRSTTYIEAAQKFEIMEENANITQVKLYILYVDLYKDGDHPCGSVSIFNDNNGEPGVPLGTTPLEEVFGSLDLGVDIGPTWVNFTFPTPIRITQGFYWIVLSDTGNQAVCYWEWYTQRDLNNGDSGDWAVKSTHDTSWELNPDNNPSDLLSWVKITPISEPEPDPEPKPEPEPVKYWYIFTKHGMRRRWTLSYNVTFTIEHDSKIKFNKRIDIFRINIETIELVSECTNPRTSNKKVILGVIISNTRSFLIFLQDEFQIESYQRVIIIFKIPRNNTDNKFYHVMKVISFNRRQRQRNQHEEKHKHKRKHNHKKNSHHQKQKHKR